MASAQDGELKLTISGSTSQPTQDPRAWANGGPINMDQNWVFSIPMSRDEINQAGREGRNMWEEARRELIAHAGTFLPPGTPFEIRQTQAFKDPTDPQGRVLERLGWCYEPAMIQISGRYKWEFEASHESRRWSQSKEVWVWGRYIAKPPHGVN